MKKVSSILLVDDDDATNFINSLLIRDLSLTDKLVVAKNGKDALKKIQEGCEEDNATPPQVPDLILLDINMPVLDGFGFLQAFSSLDCPGKETAVIVVLTSSLNPKDLERVKKSNVKAFISKPLTKESLENVVFTYLG